MLWFIKLLFYFVTMARLSVQDKTCSGFGYFEGKCACVEGGNQLTRKQAAPKDNKHHNRKQNHRFWLRFVLKWKQMLSFRSLRPFCLKRKYSYGLIAGVLMIFIYNQVLSYSILSQTNEDMQFRKDKFQHDCLLMSPEEIDVVYTWVNGSEEVFLEEMRRFSGEDLAPRPDSYAPQRFSDKQELKYSLRSIEKHMPWVRHVYIVTNEQIPSWLDLDYGRVSVVTHRDIFEDDKDLPTFSSPAIEANLHRIPGLSNKFIYFNDDVFLYEDVYPEDFYTRNRGYKIYTAWGTDCAHKCEWGYINNNKCDPACYNADCDFDGGDCDSERDKILNKYKNNIFNINNRPPSSNTNSSNHLINKSHNNSTNTSIPNFLTSNNTNITLIDRIKLYNQEKMKSHKLIKLFQRERDLFHVNTMNRMVANLFPSQGQNDDVISSITSITTNGNALNTNTIENGRKDLYSSSLVFTQRLLGRKFGYKRRNVIAHAPIMINKAIMAEVQRIFPEEFKTTMSNKFRAEDNLQIAFVYSYYLSLVQVRKSIEEIFDEYDTDHSGSWSDREIHTLLARIYPLPLKIEMVLEFQTLLNNCTNSMSSDQLRIEYGRSSPKYERYVDSLLTIVTKQMIINCVSLHNVLKNQTQITHKGKYRHEFIEAAEHVSFNQLHSVMASAMDTLNNIRKTPRKFVCINDDLDRTNATRVDNELLLTLLEDFFVSLFPTPSKFELPPEYRNRFARMEELRAWQKWRWRGVMATILPESYFRFGILWFFICSTLIGFVFCFVPCYRLFLRLCINKYWY